MNDLPILPEQPDHHAEYFGVILGTDNWISLVPGDFQRALGTLIDAGKVINLDAAKKRPKRPLHWEKKGERLKLVEDPG